jgi:PmbA protein
MPVIYDPRVSNSLLGHLSGAINGAAIARGTSFLKEKLGQQIFAAGINIHEDPRRMRGSRSWTFDAEGVPTQPRAIIEDGVLQTWLLDSRSARQLGLRSTGNATRGTGGPHQFLHGARHRHPRRADGWHRGRHLRHRNARLQHQLHHRRL